MPSLGGKKKWDSGWCKWVFPKIGVPPQIIHFNRVFPYFHHPFWGAESPYFWFNTQMRWYASEYHCDQLIACFLWTDLRLASTQGHWLFALRLTTRGPFGWLSKCVQLLTDMKVARHEISKHLPSYRFILFSHGVAATVWHSKYYCRWICGFRSLHFWKHSEIGRANNSAAKNVRIWSVFERACKKIGINFRLYIYKRVCEENSGSKRRKYQQNQPSHVPMSWRQNKYD